MSPRAVRKATNERTGVDRDRAAHWLRWWKASPVSAVLDLSTDLRSTVNATLTEKALEQINQKRHEFLQRMGCRIITLPSGAELNSPLSEPPASIVYGKLLYGGVTRYRLLGSHSSNRSPRQRRAGMRTETKATVKENPPVWMLYGGPDRMYEAVDMGPAAVLEVVLLPRGQSLTTTTTMAAAFGSNNMLLSGMTWKPQNMFDFFQEHTNHSVNGDEVIEYAINGYSLTSLSGKDRNDTFRSKFRSAVGGLQPQIDAIVRRVLDGCVIRPVDSELATEEQDSTAQEFSPTAALEAEELERLGLSPVRGLLLYGPADCGKTALAREISRALRARTPTIVSAPELLDRWVGGSEKLVRLLFADAEAELASCNGDATKSALHVIVIDEIDSVFRRRSSSEDSGEATRSSVVNQILAKLDGMNSIPNVLLIGMTNRRELLDEALLRPGRLEVQIEIPLPDKSGRREILQIHFEALRRRGRLSLPLCCAIDGVPLHSAKDDTNRSVEDMPLKQESSNASQEERMPRTGRKREAIRRAFDRVVPSLVRPGYDLAADHVTGGFSGADIAGLVRCAGSIALSRSRKDGTGVDGLLITLEDVKQALLEVKR